MLEMPYTTYIIYITPDPQQQKHYLYLFKTSKHFTSLWIQLCFNNELEHE